MQEPGNIRSSLNTELLGSEHSFGMGNIDEKRAAKEERKAEEAYRKERGLPPLSFKEKLKRFLWNQDS